MKTSACCSCTLKYNGTEIYRCAGCNQQCDATGTPLAWTVAEERDRYKAALERLLEFGNALLVSEDEDERGIGWCVCEGARVVAP